MLKKSYKKLLLLIEGSFYFLLMAVPLAIIPLKQVTDK
nr:MAG TPA: hypothetical protein [Caudoviricetes sp.]